MAPAPNQLRSARPACDPECSILSGPNDPVGGGDGRGDAASTICPFLRDPDIPIPSSSIPFGGAKPITHPSQTAGQGGRRCGIDFSASLRASRFWRTITRSRPDVGGRRTLGTATVLGGWRVLLLLLLLRSPSSRSARRQTHSANAGEQSVASAPRIPGTAEPQRPPEHICNLRVDGSCRRRFPSPPRASTSGRRTLPQPGCVPSAVPTSGRGRPSGPPPKKKPKK